MDGGLIRAIALDVHSQRLGWVVLEGSERLVEWGTNALSYACPSQLHDRFRGLVDRFDPELLIIKRYQTHGSSKAKQAVSALAEQALDLEVGVRRVSRGDVRDQYRSVDPFTKYEVARAIARVFPELSDRLPRRRTAWRREDNRVLLFEAVAIGTTQLAREHRERFAK